MENVISIEKKVEEMVTISRAEYDEFMRQKAELAETTQKLDWLMEQLVQRCLKVSEKSDLLFGNISCII